MAETQIDLGALEREWQAAGYRLIAGVDEAGRGPLAGPVVAAAVILDPARPIAGLNDSKKLTAAARERLYAEIHDRALTLGVSIVNAAIVDKINILQATLRGMGSAIAALEPVPDLVLLDGNQRLPELSATIRQETLVKGDARCAAIAAASIVAKVTRDRLMAEWDIEYPGYGFAGHKGYGTAAHLAAIAQLGPSPIHRLTFAGVKEHVGRAGLGKEP